MVRSQASVPLLGRPSRRTVVLEIRQGGQAVAHQLAVNRKGSFFKQPQFFACNGVRECCKLLEHEKQAVKRLDAKTRRFIEDLP
jgi:hypothetical protein